MANKLARQRFREELRKHEPVAPQELLDKCLRDWEGAVMSTIAHSNQTNFMAVTLLSLCKVEWTSYIPAAAVTSRPGTGPVLCLNPFFWANQLDDRDTTSKKFVVMHEMFHLILRHLGQGDPIPSTTDGSSNLSSRTLAQEIACNHLSSKMVNGSLRVPRAYPELENGSLGDTLTDYGIDPEQVYGRYKDDLKKQGIDPVDFHKFVESELSTMACLDSMLEPPHPPRLNRMAPQQCGTCGSQIQVKGGGQSGDNGQSDEGDSDEAGGSGGSSDEESQGEDGSQSGSGGSGDQEDESSEDGSAGGSGDEEGSGDQEDGDGAGDDKCPDCGQSQDGSGPGGSAPGGSGGKMRQAPSSSGWHSSCIDACGEDHGDGSSDADDDSADRDSTDIAQAVDRAIEITIQKAQVDGNEQAKDALRDLMQTTAGSDSASKMWGDMGAGAVFGEKIEQPTATKFWASWLRGTIASKLKPGRRPMFNKRTVAVDTQLDRDPFLVNKGKQREKLLWVFIDTSGSMPGGVLEWIRTVVGDEDKLEIEYWCFDTELYEIEPGDPLKGRGGTCFFPIDDHYNKAEEKPDALVVFTDGYAEAIEPVDPHKWVWMFPPADSPPDWVVSQDMDSYVLTDGDMENMTGIHY